ncbi:response regulator [Cohnella sp. CFH 77786]|uniref:response regulator transcription factor n=1 Tax=Cohnella sp. CFH 77786 TaxID=2662265 RepID=UPI001C609F52|nr:response regulator [Cohnella sp. CFH 77786]MBW5448555.1 response regulator [Cohnella sp. CFH 77786]
MCKVLIVDDEHYIRERLQNIIPWHEYGMNVAGLAEDGADGLAKIAALRPDIVISDIRMPDMNGLDMIRRALERSPETRFVVLSAYGEFEFAKQAIQLGVSDYLLKPTQPSELLDVLTKLVDRINQEKRKQRADTLADSYGQAITAQYIHELALGQHPGYGWEEEYANVGLGWLLQGSLRLLLVTMNRSGSGLPDNPESVRTMQFAVQNVMYETLSGQEAMCPVRIAAGRWLIAAGGSLSEPAAFDFARELHENIRRYTKQRVMLLVSEPIGGVLEMSGAFWEMEKAAETIATSESEPVLAMSRLREAEGWISWSQPAHELIRWVLEGDAEKINRWIGELTPSFLAWDLEAARQWCYEWLTSLRELTKHRGNDDGGGEAEGGGLRMQIASQPRQKELLRFFGREVHRCLKTCRFEGPHPLIRAAMDIIKRDYGHDIQLAAIAEDLGLSPVYLSEFFKKETGVTFRHYLLQVRMNEAARLLKDPRLKVYEVADVVGYRKVEHFVKLFKKEFGMTPSEYRGALV